MSLIVSLFEDFQRRVPGEGRVGVANRCELR